MVLLKSLKAKLSSIPSEVAVCRRPCLERLEYRQAFVRPLAVATLSRMWGPLEAPDSRSLAQSFGCSLSQGRKVGLPLEEWQESWPNFT